MRQVLRLGGVGLVAALVLVNVVRAESRHSGTVLSVDPRAATVVIGEVGPWQVKDGETVLIRRTFRLVAGTDIVRVERRPRGAPGGWPNGFVEVPVPVTAVTRGTFVTVETEGTGRPPVARKVSLVATGGS